MKLGPQQYLMIKMCFRNLGRIICSVVMWVASCVRAIFINSIFISTSPPLTQSMLLRRMKMSKQRKLHKRFLHYHPITASNFTKNMEWTLKKQHSGSIQSTRQASSERTLIAPSLHFPSPLNATYTYYRVFLLLVNQRRESTTGYKGQVDIPLFQHLQQSHTPQKHAATRKTKRIVKIVCLLFHVTKIALTEELLAFIQAHTLLAKSISILDVLLAAAAAPSCG